MFAGHVFACHMIASDTLPVRGLPVKLLVMCLPVVCCMFASDMFGYPVLPVRVIPLVRYHQLARVLTLTAAVRPLQTLSSCFFGTRALTKDTAYVTYLL